MLAKSLRPLVVRRQSMLCLAVLILVLPVVVFGRTGTILAASEVSPQTLASPQVDGPQPTDESQYADGTVMMVREKTLVISVQHGMPRPGDRFEVYVELPQDMGTVTIASGRVAGVEAGLAIAEIERRQSNARLASDQRVRFLPGGGAAPVTPVEPATPATPPTAVPSEPPIVGFQHAVQRYGPALLLVKDDRDQVHGTAFVISREHRLLATNAHVADVATQVVLNDSRTVYRIRERWYHPDTVRVMNLDHQTPMRATEPQVGPLHTSATDLAVLQLESLGPDLQGEVRLAFPEDLGQILGAEVGMYGYPGYDTSTAPGQFVRATFVRGSINRFDILMGFPDDQPLAQRRHVAFSAGNYPGFSGSPVFLQDGKVVAVSSSVRLLEDGSKISYGIRIDALWDMLVHYDLADKISPRPTSLPAPVLIAGQNRAAVQLLEANRLVQQVERDCQAGRTSAAVSPLAKALELAPEYWRLHRAKSRLIEAEIDSGSVPANERGKAYIASLEAMMKADQLFNRGFKGHLIDVVLDVARLGINASRFAGDAKHLQAALNVLADKDVFNFAMQHESRAQFLALRATLKRDLYQQDRRDTELLRGALEDIEAAVRAKPDHAAYRRELDRIRSLRQP